MTMHITARSNPNNSDQCIIIKETTPFYTHTETVSARKKNKIFIYEPEHQITKKSTEERRQEGEHKTLACNKGTSSIGSSAPKSPRATIACKHFKHKISNKYKMEKKSIKKCDTSYAMRIKHTYKVH